MARSTFRCVLIVIALIGPAAARAGSGPSLEEIRREIDARGYHWTAGPTTVSDRGWEALEATLRLWLPPGYADIPRVDFSRIDGKALDLPERWDWRGHEGTTPVRDQGDCGSCWAFASVAALEGCARITDHTVYDLSEQQQLSCNSFGYGCGGGWFDGCVDLFHTMGAVGEECMPYLASDAVPCEISGCEALVRASGMIPIEKSVPSIQGAVHRFGPIACAMSVQPDFSYYREGCYEHEGSGQVNHAVVIVPVPGNVVMVETVPLETTTDETSPLDIVSELTSKAGVPIDPDSARLCYRVNGGEWTRILLESGRESGRWVARIPALPMPSTIDYFIQASDIDGHRGCAPPVAPDSCYSFDVARHWDKFEMEGTGWSVGAIDDEATMGIWECADPVGTEAQPENDHSGIGTICWVTGQHLQGRETGYNDVDGGKTTLLSPGFDLFGTRTARPSVQVSTSRGSSRSRERPPARSSSRGSREPTPCLLRGERPSNGFRLPPFSRPA